MVKNLVKVRTCLEEQATVQVRTCELMNGASVDVLSLASSATREGGNTSGRGRAQAGRAKSQSLGKRTKVGEGVGWAVKL